MNCPQCGLYLPDANVDRCPRCGWVPATGGGPTTPTPGYGLWSAPSAAPPSPGATMPYGSGFPPGPPPPDSWTQAQQRGLTADALGAQGPAAPPNPPPGAPTYGQPAPPSVPYYGQYAPPSMPMYGQYAPPSMPMYGQAAPPSMGQQPAWGSPFPPPPPRKSNVGLIVGIALIVVLLLGGGAGFLIYAAQQNNPQAGGASPNATATTAPTATSTTHALFQDAFNDPSSGWVNDTHCGYQSDGYHIKDGYICYAPAGNFTDATVSATVKQISGSIRYPYGIAFRITSQSYYQFDIDSNGKWVIFKCGASACTRLVDYTAAAALHPNLNASNTLKVVMRGSQFTFYANGTQLGSTNDPSYTSGQVGVDCGSGIEAVFTSFEIDPAS